ncbi:Structural maintenance of chromosomes protein 3 [Orchesella cincta]|uniref:Structural maintenance of chromosomes protein n=1 Tax=Orchesella cincta TaxID=48709 RepID=A0A1D2N6V1_ORCCI|nr:Structural maintenance of chromosomes protein 3 [Orchesella cincta]
MFIKEIAICGFKSYKDKIVINDIFNGLNVIVGRNGSGKSNIFAAIEFALTLEYKYMKPEARNALIHHGRTITDPAYVEISFDNSDQKLPINEETVTFKRVLSSKKDKFFVNGKELTNAKQFLDLAGFTNPYFIVKQGRVHDLALATDAGRLKIISDVAGTTAYDDKISDCRRSFDEATEKQKEISDMMTELATRKESLENEVAEQKRYMKKDQSKRAIEYVLHEREMQVIQRNISDLEERRSKSTSLQQPVRIKLDRTCRDSNILKRDIGEMKIRVKQLQDLRDEYEASRNSIASNLASYKQELADVRNRNTASSSEYDVPQLEDQIEAQNKELQDIDTELDDLKEQIDQLHYEKCQLDIRMKEMTEVEHRKKAFKNPTQYRNHLQKTLRNIDEKLVLGKTSVEKANTSISATKTMLLEETETLENIRQNLASYESQIRSINQGLEDNRIKQCSTKTELDSIWRELSETDQELGQQKERVARLEDECKKCYGGAVLEGWKGVKKVIDDLRNTGRHQEVVQGYYGLVTEHIQCDSNLDTAIEVAAGKKLVYHIVQSKNVAKVILRQFNTRKLRGEVNFLPIDGLIFNCPNLPQDLRFAKPLINSVQYDAEVARVIEFILGHTLLCDSLETATAMMRQYKLQCVTLDGEKVSKVGVMAGGHNRRGPQKLELQRTKNVDDHKLMELIQSKSALDNKSNFMNENHKSLKQEQEKLNLKKAKLSAKKHCSVCEVKTQEKKVQALKELLETQGRELVNLKSNCKALEEKKRICQSELDGSAGEDEIVAVKNIRAVMQRYNDAMKELSLKQNEKSGIEGRLLQSRTMYYKKLDSSMEAEKPVDDKEATRLADLIKTLNPQVTKMQSKIDEAHRELVALEKKMVDKQKELDKLLDTEGKLKDELNVLCADLESFAENYLHWHTKLQEHNAAAGKLGSIPANLANYEDLREKELLHKLKKLNLKLKNKVEINQKAIQQFNELSEKYAVFQEQIKEYESEGQDISLLLKDLENKKGEAMLRNVRVLQEQFGKIFRSIVPKGNAELMLYGENITVDCNKDINSANLIEMAGQNMFLGVSVSVNFLGQQLHNMRSLAQLSGGQKSIVALSLILAIQTIDPVPFYLFDEVDQALDSAYRDSVAKVIAEMSERSQFICTTFRKEIVDVADKVYGVSCQNNCSHVQPISDTQALDFVVESSDPGISSMASSISPNGSYYHNSSTA